MRRALLLLLLLPFAGCGTSPETPSVPRSAIRPTLPSARVPEGARGAARDHTQFLNGPPPVALRGGSIHLDHAGAVLIENFEEIQKAVYCPYWDAYGHVWTRGFGETDWGGNFGGRCITNAQATANLVYFVESKYIYAVRNLGVDLNQCQVDALASFVWNLGPGIFGGSLGGAMRRHDWGAILAYDRAGGVVLSGLARRRRVEYGYLAGRCGLTPKPPPFHRHDLEARRRALRRVLVRDGCTRRRHQHQRLGPRCTRWFHEGDVINHRLKVGR